MSRPVDILAPGDEEPAHILTHRGVVYPAQCDHNGHLNVMWYVGRFDEATWCLFADLGITPDYLRASRRGMVAVDQHLRYARELVAGDTLAIHSRVVEVSARSLRFEHRMYKNGEAEVAATASLTGVHIDAELRRACPFPEDLRAAIATAIAAPRAPKASPSARPSPGRIPT